MKIRSPFRDYYDSAHGWYSPDPMYVRKTYKIKPPERDRFVYKKIWDGRTGDIYDAMPRYDNYQVPRCLLCFCGKAYPFWTAKDVHSKVHYFYTLEDLEIFLTRESTVLSATTTINYRHVINELQSKNKMHWWSRWSRNNRYAFSLEGYKAFVDNVDLIIPAEEFIEVDAPVFLLTDKEKIVNPELRLIDFVTQVDPFTAYQEIEMFIGNQLVKQMDPDLKRTDEEIAESKGFDRKTSFRKCGWVEKKKKIKEQIKGKKK